MRLIRRRVSLIVLNRSIWYRVTLQPRDLSTFYLGQRVLILKASLFEPGVANLKEAL